MSILSAPRPPQGTILCLSEFWHEEGLFYGLRQHAVGYRVSVVNITVLFWICVLALAIVAPFCLAVLLLDWENARRFIAEQPYDFDVKRKAAKYPELLARSGIWKAAFCAIGLFHYTQLRILFWVLNPAALVVWNGMGVGRASAIFLARLHKIRVVYLENGCMPNTVAVDAQGINFHNSVPRNADFYRMVPPDHSISRTLVPRAARTPKEASGAANRPLPKRFVFVPFQVYTDTQIVMFSPLLRSMHDLYALLERSVGLLADEELCFVVKEHPSCGQTYGELHERNPRIVFANDETTENLIRQAECVMTVNSSVGVEAILHHQRVVTLGQAFYNIPGIVRGPLLEGEPPISAADLPAWVARELNGLDVWQPDVELMQQFVTYLKKQYLANGSMAQPTDDVYRKILDLAL